MIIKDVLITLQDILTEGRSKPYCDAVNINLSEEERKKKREILRDKIKQINSNINSILAETGLMKDIGKPSINGNTFCNKIDTLLASKKFEKEIEQKLIKLKELKRSQVEKANDFLQLGCYNTLPPELGNFSGYFPDKPGKSPIIFCGACLKPLKFKNKEQYKNSLDRMRNKGGFSFCGNYIKSKNNEPDLIDDAGCFSIDFSREGLHEVTCDECGKKFMQEKHKNKVYCPTCAKKLFSKVSQLEKFVGEGIEKQFKEAGLIITFSDRTTLFAKGDRKGNSVELDILVSDPKNNWKVAIEVNGAHHYKPIWAARGKTPEETFEAIRLRDLKKQERCKNLGIDLLILNIGGANYSKSQASKALEIAINFINNKIINGEPIGVEEIVV